MKVKVLVSNKQTKDGKKFVSYWTPVHIQVFEGEEDKGVQKKGLTLNFSKEAEKKLPVKFNGGILECKGEDVIAPYVYKITKDEKTGKDNYPNVYIKDFDSVEPLPKRESTCVFDIDEQDTEESDID